MEDFKNDIEEVKERLTKLYDEVVTHEAEAVIELLLDNLEQYTKMYKEKIESDKF